MRDRATLSQSAHSDAAITPLGWVLVGFRILLMLLVLVACVPLHLTWRVLGWGRLWARLFLAAIGMIAGLHITTLGKPERRTLLLANHVTWLDIPALAHMAGSAFVAHDGLSEFGFLKWLCEMNDTVFVARHERTSVADQIAQVRAAIDDDNALTIFPEGTTSDGTDVIPFKSSLLSAASPLPDGVSAQPVVLQYQDAADIAWVGEEPGMANFLRILARLRPVRLDIRFLPPLSGPALQDRKTMTMAAQQAISRQLAG